MTGKDDGVLDMAAVAYEQILDLGGPGADLAMLIWPHLTDDQRVGTIFDGDGDPWAMAAATLEVCPEDVVVPEDILAEFEEEARDYLAEDGADVYAEMALLVIANYRKFHAARRAGAGVEESPSNS